MTLKFYNTLTRKKEVFKPLKPGLVTIYTCGPTVYDYAHIGNLRAFMFYDILRRYLKYKGYKIKHVMNITDVDDKTIRNSREQGLSLKQFTEKFTKIFFEDIEKLNIEKPEVIPKATEHIKEMVDLVKVLLKKGYAYKGDDGSIYYDISKFKDYGKLSKIKFKELKVGARVVQDEYTKEEGHDFALWKAWTPEDGEVFWETEIGKGRPGWHIECSVMSMKYLGKTIDIHAGGIDLIFPHHENEIAQSEAASGKPFVRYWTHNEHVLVNGQKMSKSLGNFFTLRDLLKKGHDPKAIRFALLNTHYKSKLNITEEALLASREAVEKLLNFMDLLREVRGGEDNKKINDLIKKAKDGFEKYMDDDLDTGHAVASIFDFVKEVNKLVDKKQISENDTRKCLELMENFDRILGVLEKEEPVTVEFIGSLVNFLVDLRKDLGKKHKDLAKKIDQEMGLVEDMGTDQKTLQKLMNIIIGIREEVRKKKDYKLSDRIRADLKGLNIVLEDKKKGVRWRRI